MIIRMILKTGLCIGLLCSQGVMLSMATLVKRIPVSGLAFKPVIRGNSQRMFSQFPVPQPPKKLKQISALVERYYQDNKEQCNNLGVATAVGLGTCVLFPLLPKILGAYLITRGVYRVVASPVKKEAAKTYLNQWFNNKK